MGKGTIVSGGTNGLYTVDFDYGSARADQLIAYYETVISDLETAITEAESAEFAASSALSAALGTLNSRIETYKASEAQEDKDAVESATDTVAEQSVLKDRASSKAASLKYRKMAIESRLATLQAIDTTERASVWCVDLTEDGSGDVGTIEINGEGPAKLIVPGCAAYGYSDGDMKARGVQSPEQVFLNAAILPGWQKFSPTYRIGTISDIDYDNDLCSVTLDAATSSAQGLGINQSGLLESVEVEYMNCNSKAFDNGDEVVVKFEGQSWSSPKVIGFVSNPKPCGPYEIAFLVEYGTTSTVYTHDWGMPRAASDADPDGEVTTPGSYPGYVLNTQTWPLTGEGAPQSGDYVFGADHTALRIRYDHAFFRNRSTDDYFTFDLISSITEATDGTYTTLSCIADTGTYVGAGNNFTLTFDESGLSTATWGGSPPSYVPYDVVVGTLVKEYYYASIVVGETLHKADAGAYDAHMRGLWNPPASVTLDIDGRDLNYNLLRFGPLIDLSGYSGYFDYTPFGGGSPSSKLARQYFWAVYRRGNS